MNPVREDLINEIIRVSQTNLLGANRPKDETRSDEQERDVMEWIKNNAAAYRNHFRVRLDACSTQDLAGMLKELIQSRKSLNEIFKDRTSFFPRKRQKISH